MSAKFLIDNNLSVQLAKGMKEFGENVFHLTEEFSPDTADPIWLKHIGENNIFLVTRDNAIRRRPAELRALKNHKIGAFFLGGKDLTRCQLILQLVRNWPRIKEFASKTERPFAFRVRPYGREIDPIPLT